MANLVTQIGGFPNLKNIKLQRELAKEESRLARKDFRLRKRVFEEEKRKSSVTEPFEEKRIALSEREVITAEGALAETVRATGVSEGFEGRRVTASEMTSRSLAGLHDASKRLQDAQADVVADTEIRSYNRQIKNLQVLLGTEEYKNAQATNDLVNSMFYSADSDDHIMARDFLLKRKENTDFTQQMQLMGLQFEGMRTQVTVQDSLLRNSAQNQKELSNMLELVLHPQFEKLMKGRLPGETVEDVRAKAMGAATRQEVGEKPSGTGEKVMEFFSDLLGMESVDMPAAGFGQGTVPSTISPSKGKQGIPSVKSSFGKSQSFDAKKNKYFIENKDKVRIYEGQEFRVTDKDGIMKRYKYRYTSAGPVFDPVGKR